MAPQKLLHERVQFQLRIDSVLHDYLRAVANLETFNERRSYSMTQLINDLILEGIQYRIGEKDLAVATKELEQDLARALGIDSVDALNQTKR